jgi:superoxide dismutase, Fe-Mn family
MRKPRELSRREVIRTAAALGLGATALALAGPAVAAEAGPFPKGSGLVTGKPRKLKYDAVPGLLSKAQVTPHYNAHYGGALKRYAAIEAKLDRMLQGKEALGGDDHTLLVKDRLNRMNSVLLHELYFDNVAARPPAVKDELKKEIAKRFGSLARWEEDFKACCLAAAGWGVLARDLVNGKLYNVASDTHENGVIWLGQPLVVCDVYEHAFYVDYQNKKAEYVGKFMQFLDWDEIGARWKALKG